MANSYTLFSVAIDFGGDGATEQRRWFDGVAWVIENYFNEDKVLLVDVEGNKHNLGPLLYEDALTFVQHHAENCSNVSLEIDSDCVVIHSGDSGDPELAALIIEAYLHHFHINYGVHLEFAMTCSSMRPGEFGGGAAYVTRFGIEWMDQHAWLTKQQKRIADKIAAEARRKRKAKKPATKRRK